MCTAFFTSTSFRLLHLNSICLKTSSQAKVMHKIMQGTVKKKTFHPHTSNNSLPALTDLLGKSKGITAKISVRRRAVLDAFFAERITEMLSCSRINFGLEEHGFFVTKVKYATDGSALHVYWSADKNISAIEPILPALGGQLRHELSQLQGGKVPHINFIYDRSTYKATDVEELLKKADFGPDYQPADRMTDERLEPKADEKIVKRTDVLGLDRGEIMKQILRSMNAASKQQNERNSTPIYDVSREIDFKKYIREQHILRAKKKKRDSYDPDLVNIMNTQRKEEYEDEDDAYEEDEDFSTEDDLHYEEPVK